MANGLAQAGLLHSGWKILAGKDQLEDTRTVWERVLLVMLRLFACSNPITQNKNRSRRVQIMRAKFGSSLKQLKTQDCCWLLPTGHAQKRQIVGQRSRDDACVLCELQLTKANRTIALCNKGKTGLVATVLNGVAGKNAAKRNTYLLLNSIFSASSFLVGSRRPATQMHIGMNKSAEK